MADTQLVKVRSISEFHKLRGLEMPEHPLISVVDYASIQHSTEYNNVNWMFDFYSIAIKRGLDGKMRYGQQEYDFDEGVMFFMSPNQVFGTHVAEDPARERSGWLLLIHPDFLWNTALAREIRKYDFFDYAVNEALFLSEKEERTITSLISNIRHEYLANMDRFSQKIIITQLETLLNYSERFYQRQFITRKITGHQVLTRLEELLDRYFDEDEPIGKGLPTVQMVSRELNISPGYLSALLRNLTGQSTQQHIHDKLIEKAKEQLSTTTLSVGEIAFALGFEHTQSFSKLFKSKTSLSPLEFRQSFS